MGWANIIVTSWETVAEIMRLLLVEDEEKIARLIKKGLQEEHYSVDVSHDGEEGFYLATCEEYDLIILDIMIPKRDGLEVLKELRAKGIKTPVLFLTARDRLEDKIEGLDAGGDDYLVKPFAFAELSARVRALLRRGRVEKDPKLKFADLAMDTVTRKVFKRDEEIAFTAKEYSLLEYFMSNPERVLTRTMISEHIWDYSFDLSSNVIDVYVNSLRKKIESPGQRLIHTVRGVGYVLKVEG